MARQKSALNGFLAGGLGGALGTLVLNVFQKGSLEATRVAESTAGTDQRFTHEQEEQLHTFEEAHARTAAALAGEANPATSHPRYKAAAPAVELGFGILCGAAYGALAEVLPSVTTGFGAAFGAVLFTGASEMVLPAMGYVPAPQQRTPVQHTGGFLGNMVYGMCTEAIRRLLRPE